MVKVLRYDARRDAYNFTLKGYIVPAVRMTQRSKWSPRAKRYLTSQTKIGWRLKLQMRENDWEMLPESTPLWASIIIHRAGGLHTCDLDNQVKAILDAAQGIVFKNDLWIDDIKAQRMLSDDKIDWAEFRIGLMGAI